MINTAIHVGTKGRFKVEAFKQDADGNEIAGTRRVAADWFDNLIVDAGLDALASMSGVNTTTWAQLFDRCAVGSGSTAPANNNTALVSQIAVSTTVQADTGVVDQLSTTPYYYYRRVTFRFASGSAAGNLAEVGVLMGSRMWSRALIVDGGGTPITLTILSDETLDVTYEIRVYPPASDTSWSATISGTNYSGTVRAAGVSSSAGNGSWKYAMASVGSSGNACVGCFLNAVGYGTNSYSTQTLGSLTGVPAGTASQLLSSVTASAYTAGTFYRDHTITADLNYGNSAGGIGSMVFSTFLGCFQLSCTPVLPKDNTKKLTLTVRVSWGRYP